MMEEKFSVSLELMIQKFKDNAKKAQEVAKNVGNKIKENMSVSVGTDSLKKTSAQSELLLNRINQIKKTINKLNNIEGEINGKRIIANPQKILELRVELEKLEKQYAKLNGSSNIFNKTVQNVQGSMKKSLNSAKRFTLSLFGIQSGIRMVSKASSAYLAQDTETTQKIQSAWIGLGSVFAPLLEKIANFTIKAVSYINVFIKALTGTDFLANAMAKSMNKANKSATSLAKTLAGFDELNNLEDSANGVSDTSWVDSFKEVELNPKFVKAIQDFASKVKIAVDKVKEHWKEIAIIFGAYEIGKLVASIGTLIGVTGGKAGILGIVTALTVVVGYLTYEFITKFKEAMKVEKDLIDLNKQETDIWIDGLEQAYGWLDKNKDQLDRIKEKREKGQELTKEETELLKKENDVRGLIELNEMKLLEKVKKNGELTEDQKKRLEELKGKYEDIANVNLDKEMNIEVVLKESEKNKSFLGKLWDSFKNTFFGGKAMVPGLGGGYADGLDYVPFEGLYHLHPGEKVVPSKFNSDEYVSRVVINKDNSDIIDKLDELIETLEQKDMNAYIDGKKVGKVAKDYIDSQNRIMGVS